jgi:uncharacterized protein (TIGR02217 family)
MAFHNIRFPEHISYGSSGGPEFSTSVLSLASGFEKRNINWSKLRAKYEVAHAIKDAVQMREIRDFFVARMGRAHSFRYKDFADFEIINTLIGTGNGVNKVFQVVRSYTSGGYKYDRQITKLVTGTLTGVLVNGTLRNNDISDQVIGGSGYTVDYNAGTITFFTAPANTHQVVVDFIEFDVHVRFDTDWMQTSFEDWDLETWGSIPLVEIKEGLSV